MPHSVRIPRPKPRLQVGTIAKRTSKITLGNRTKYYLVVNIQTGDVVKIRRWRVPQQVWSRCRRDNVIVRRGHKTFDVIR